MRHVFVDLDASCLDLKSAESPAAGAWNELITSLARYGELSTACGHDRSSPGVLLLVIRSRDVPLSEDDVRTALAPLTKLLAKPPRLISAEYNGVLCPIGRRFMKNFRPYVSRSIVYLPLNSTADDDFGKAFVSFVQLVFAVHYRGPSSDVRTDSTVKALGVTEYQGQMCQAVLVFITWEETDDELVKQKNFRETLGEPDSGSFPGRRYLGIEEQNWQFETLEYFGPTSDVVVVEEKRTCVVM